VLSVAGLADVELMGATRNKHVVGKVKQRPYPILVKSSFAGYGRTGLGFDLEVDIFLVAHDAFAGFVDPPENP